MGDATLIFVAFPAESTERYREVFGSRANYASR